MCSSLTLSVTHAGPAAIIHETLFSATPIHLLQPHLIPCAGTCRDRGARDGAVASSHVQKISLRHEHCSFHQERRPEMGGSIAVPVLKDVVIWC